VDALVFPYRKGCIWRHWRPIRSCEMQCWALEFWKRMLGTI